MRLMLLVASLVFVFAVPAEAQSSYLPSLTNGDSDLRGGGGFSNQTVADSMYKKNLYPEAFTNLGAGDVYYFIDDAADSVSTFNVSNDQYIESWPLTGFKQLITLVGEESIGNDFRAGAISDSVTHASDFDVDTSPKVALTGSYGTVHGCLQRYPLRYGDVDGDGKQELVLNLGADWAIFSLATHQMMFIGRWRIEDVLSEERVQEMRWTHTAATDPQYVAESGIDPNVNTVLPARRSYAKFYLGDFDGNGKPDILMWRKAYQSRLNSDTVKGYKLIGEALVQYELENGVYVKKDTASATVKGWLAAKNLTWQQGYPNVSECPGEEGKPIPETVDPLLNDPDVLQ